MKKTNGKVHPFDQPTVDPDVREVEEELKRDSLNNTKIGDEQEPKTKKKKKKPPPVQEGTILG